MRCSSTGASSSWNRAEQLWEVVPVSQLSPLGWVAHAGHAQSCSCEDTRRAPCSLPRLKNSFVFCIKLRKQGLKLPKRQLLGDINSQRFPGNASLCHKRSPEANNSTCPQLPCCRHFILSFTSCTHVSCSTLPSSSPREDQNPPAAWP